MENPIIYFEEFMSYFGNVSTSIEEVFYAAFFTVLIGVFIIFVYRKTFSGLVYNHRFNSSILLVSLITSMIILSIRSNFVISLGMVGALSIIRFRTAIKEPLDLSFMFWGIAVGITNGALLFHVAIIYSLIIGFVIIFFIRNRNTNNAYLLVIQYQNNEHVTNAIKNIIYNLEFKVRTKTVNKEYVELTLEVFYLNEKTDFMDEIVNVEGVFNASLVNYNGSFIE